MVQPRKDLQNGCKCQFVLYVFVLYVYTILMYVDLCIIKYWLFHR